VAFDDFFLGLREKERERERREKEMSERRVKNKGAIID
jgi:hypothetical protein